MSCRPLDALLKHWPALLEADQADQLLRRLLDDIAWQQPMVQVYGRRHRVPRKVAWIADPGLDYHYSGQHHAGRGWPDWLQGLRGAVEQRCKQPFNAVLLNLYRNGQDAMGYHRDNEPELGASPWVASYSLGASRDFVFRPYRRGGTTRQCLSLPLGHNQLLLMAPLVQRDYEHALPRRARQDGVRINLTFRYVQAKNR